MPGSAGGAAEAILGKAIAGRRREVVLATKVGMKVGSAPDDQGTSRPAVRKHLELSLRRLRTDYIDIYYLHAPGPATPLAETLRALDEVIREGKIRHYGISNYSADQTVELLAVADENGLPRPVISQPPLSLLKQDVLSDLLPLCEREGIGVAPYQVLQGGLLTGKYRRDRTLPPDSRKVEKPGWMWDLDDELFDRLEAVESQARQAGLEMTQYAIRWALAQPAVAAVVIGAKHPEQLDDILSSVTD